MKKFRCNSAKRNRIFKLLSITNKKQLSYQIYTRKIWSTSRLIQTTQGNLELHERCIGSATLLTDHSSIEKIHYNKNILLGNVGSNLIRWKTSKFAFVERIRQLKHWWTGSNSEPEIKERRKGMGRWKCYLCDIFHHSKCQARVTLNRLWFVILGSWKEYVYNKKK